MLASSVFDISSIDVNNQIDDNDDWLIYQVQNKERTVKYFAKIGKTKYETRESQIKMINLIDTISKLRNPSILQFIGYNFFNFWRQPTLTIILEYTENDLLSILLQKTQSGCAPSQWNDTTKYIIILGIILGMKYLNSKRLSVQNLKPNHIFLDKNLYPKICNYNYVQISEENDQQLEKQNIYDISFISYKLSTNNLSEINYSEILGEKNKCFYKECLSDDPNERPTLNELIEIMINKPDDNFFSELKVNDVISFLDHFYSQYEDSDVKYYREALKFDHSDDELDKSDAIESIQKLADAGNPSAMFKYAQILKDADHKRSIFYLQKAIEQKNSNAMFAYAQMLENGDGVDSDKNQAIAYYKMAIECGNSNAMYRFYKMIKNEVKGTEEFKEKADDFLKMAAKKGNLDALDDYGWQLVNNDNENNNTLGVEYIKRAIVKGSVKANYHYGCYLEKSGDRQKGIGYIKKAVESEDPEAMFDYGKRIENSNIEQSLLNIKMAADKGLRDAMFKYGTMIQKTNPKEANRYFEMSKNPEGASGSGCCIQ